MSESNATAPAAPAATPPSVTSTPASPAAPAASHAVAPNVTVNIAQPAAASPAASPAPAATAPQSPPPAAAAPIVESEPQAGNEPGWLKARLERERKATLKGLGVESEEDAKSAISAERARREAEKSELQKAQERAAKADTFEKSNEKLLSVVAQQATAVLSGLTAEQKAAVTTAAGDDPVEQLRLYNIMRATWAAPAAPPIVAAPAVLSPAAAAPAVAPQAPAAPAAPAVLPPPANTMPANAAPPPANAPPKTHAEVYAALKADPANQFKAAAYLQKFMRQIYAAPPPNQPPK